MRAVMLAMLVSIFAGCGGGGASTPPPQDLSRTIADLSGVTQPLRLDSVDDAARTDIVYSVLSLIDLDDAAPAKATTRTCPGGGALTLDVTNVGNQVRYTLDLDNCRSDGTLFDGRSVLLCTPFPGSDECQTSDLTEGDGNTPLLHVIEAPSFEASRSLTLGRSFYTRQSPDTADDNFDGVLNGRGAEMALSGSPRTDYELRELSVRRRDQGSTITVRVSGGITLAGDCGTGRLSVSTPTDIAVDKGTGRTIAGEISIANGGGQSYRFVFNGDGTVSVVSADGGQSRTFSAQQISDPCNLRG
jgi:hypothetical protein